MRQVLTWGRRPRRKTNGKHKVNTVQEGEAGREGGLISLPASPWPTLQTASLGSVLPCLTSGHISGAEEERGREEREAVERDRWEGLSGPQGVQQPDE